MKREPKYISFTTKRGMCNPDGRIVGKKYKISRVQSDGIYSNNERGIEKRMPEDKKHNYDYVLYYDIINPNFHVYAKLENEITIQDRTQKAVKEFISNNEINLSEIKKIAEILKLKVA